MIKKYYKTGHITAERFDGSAAMIDRYSIGVMPEMQIDLYADEDDPANWAPRSFRIMTLEGRLGLHLGDWIATGVNGEHWPIADDIFRKTYAELPVIPQKVADYIQKAKAGTWGIIDCYYHVADNVTACGLDGVRDWEHWIVDHQDAFARAWLDGYRIEEENDDQF